MKIVERISMVMARRTSGTGTRWWWPVAVLLAAGVVGAANAPIASAGKYHVYSCRTPNGEAAPVDGWRGSVAGPESFAEAECSNSGGGLTAALREDIGRVAMQDSATWTFQPQAQERLVSASLWRAGDADGGRAAGTTYEWWITGPEAGSQPFSECAYAAGCEYGLGSGLIEIAGENLVQAPPSSLGGGLYVTATCGGLAGYPCAEGHSDSNGFAAVVYVYAADLTLEQEVGPSATNVGGELAGAASVAGTSDVSFSASDPGSGVYEAVFSVDGQVVQRSVVDEDGGRCRDVGQTSDGLPAFLYVQPCPSSVSADVGFNSLLVGNGEHHLVVSVIDAAGNAAPVLDREITVDNPGVPGPANGTDASGQASLAVRWRSTPRERLTSAYGRTHEVTGLLTAAGGAAISGAVVEVAATPATAGAVSAAMPGVLTDQDGRFTLSLPGSVSSRALRFVYRSRLGGVPPSATATLVLSVRAGVTLAIAPHTASVGRSIYFRGRVLGAPVPHEGKQLVLEARAPGGRWIEFDDIRTNPHGGYRASYRFKFPGPATYQFRVLSEPESDYPYAQGTSNTTTIHES